MIDLEEIGSSEIPSDLSINEEEWTDYLSMEQLTEDDGNLISFVIIKPNEFLILRFTPF